MTKINQLLCAMLVTLSLIACTDGTEYTSGVWYERAPITWYARMGAAGFTIGNKGYVCSGYRGANKERLRDCWEYDIEGNYWTECASMYEVNGTDTTYASTRNAAAGFAVGSKGYIATGYYAPVSGSVEDIEDYLGDCWEYDPSSNSWTQMDDIPDSGSVTGKRRYAVAFGIGDYGYLGAGYNDNYLSDFWRFDPSAAAGSQWTLLSGTESFSGKKRMGAWAFVINNKAYVGGGLNNGSDCDDFWCFDPSKGTWTELRKIVDDDDDEEFDDDYTTITRSYAAAFVINGYGYICCGQTGTSSYRTDYWIYDPDEDLWYDEMYDNDLTNFEGSSRSQVVSFSTGSRGFVTTGGTSSSYYDDTWELKPDEFEEI